jgi:hypothetical protein
MVKKGKVESKKGGVVSRQTLYQVASKYSREAIEFLAKTMQDPTVQRSVRVSAANKLIDKTLPDLKATEISGENGGEILLRIVEEATKRNE